jgi:hypothetical protein
VLGAGPSEGSRAVVEPMVGWGARSVQNPDETAPELLTQWVMERAQSNSNTRTPSVLSNAVYCRAAEAGYNRLISRLGRRDLTGEIPNG